MSVKHKFSSIIPDGLDPALVKPSNWNDDHIADFNGIAKSVSGSLTQAIADTDYLTPTGSGALLTGITAAKVGLGNVTNESKTTMFTSPAFTGVPTGPTAAANTNTTQLSTCEFVLGQASNTSPASPLDSAVVGTSTMFARGDHSHPANFTTNATDIQMNGTQALGSSTKYARADHVHPSDTARAPLASPTFTGIVTAPSFASTVATGTAPFTVASNTMVTNLNAQYIGGTALSGLATVNQTMYIGTTAVAINRTSAALTLTGITLTSPTLTSPTLTNPALGTPASGTLTSCTGLPLSTGVTGTLPVANGGTGVTTSTGSGSVVLSTSPTLTTPSIGVATGTSFNSITGLASVAPLAPSVTAAVGTSTLTARQDHVHPTNFTATATDIKMNGTQSVGTLTTFPRADHVHPTDTSRQATLISGTNIKTINTLSILGSGDLTITASTTQATTSVLGGGYLATSAEAQAGSDVNKIITPSTLRSGLNASGTAPIYACRSWVNFNGTGTVAIRASGNVSSITDNGIADYTVNLSTPMPDENYAITAMSSHQTNTAVNCVAAYETIAPRSANQFRVLCTCYSGTGAATQDPIHVQIALLR